MKKLLFLIFSVYINFTICNTFSQVLSNPSTNREDSNDNVMVITSDQKPDEEELLYGPIKFTESGLRCFFNHKFNNPKYTQDILPHNLSDLVQLLQYAKDTNQSRRFIKSILKIFHQKFKSLEYMNAGEFTSLLIKLPDLIEYSFSPSNDTELEIKDILYSEFLNRYEFFKQDPNKFFNNISNQIYRFVSNKNEEKTSNDDISISELRSMLLRLIESGSSKLVWFIEDEPDIWTQFKNTGNSIYHIKEKNLIHDLDDINDLIHGALARFLLVLEIRGSTLDPEFFRRIYDEISNNSPVWLNIEELDEFMIQKKDILKIALKNCHVKATARQKYGIIPQ